MHTELDELWIDALEWKLDERVSNYLQIHHMDYQNACRRQSQLVRRYPIIDTFLEGNESITLNEKEHCAVRQYLADQDDKDRLEKEFHYYYGQSCAFSYAQMLKCLKKEINPEAVAAEKTELADMVIKAKAGDGEMDQKMLKNILAFLIGK